MVSTEVMMLVQINLVIEETIAQVHKIPLLI